VTSSHAALRFSACCAGFAFLLASSAANAAAPKDAQADKAIKEAMDTHYLQTQFDKAETKLRSALDACADSQCSPAVKARLLVALGTVLAGGKKQIEDATEAFAQALALDSTVEPDPDLMSGEISYAMDKARKQIEPAAATGRKPVEHKTPAEQRLHTPVPLHVLVDEALVEMVKKVSVSYLAPGAGEWKSMLLKKLGEQGFGINIPCADLRSEGALRYHITLTDEQGSILAEVGTRSQPLSTQIKKRIDGEPPSWPGFAPPELCVEQTEKRPSQCLDDSLCNEGFVCVEGVCTEPSKKPDGPGSGLQRNWISASFSPDVSLFSGDNVCTTNGQNEDHYACFRQDGTRYIGTPTQDIADNVNTGFGLSTLRVMLGYDRLILDNFTAGARLGFAFNGASGPGVAFLPVHIEARAGYWFGPNPFGRDPKDSQTKLRLRVRPFAFVSGGLAQVDTQVDVEVLEDGQACGAVDPTNINSPCTINRTDKAEPEKRRQTLKAYKQAGNGFASLGGGVSLSPIPLIAFNVALRLGVTFPVVTMVLSPEAGVSVGF
jgi:hypothetical protein